MTTDTAPTQEQRDAAALSFLEYDSSFTGPSYDYRTYEIGGREWLILTDAEATRRAIDSIRESVWAFQTDFLNGYMPEGVDAADFDDYRAQACESANPAMLALIGDRFDEFASEAIRTDGRGHFLSGYDGNEYEFEHDGIEWYAYAN